MKEFIKKYKNKIITVGFVVFTFAIGYHHGVCHTRLKLAKNVSDFFKTAEVIRF